VAGDEATILDFLNFAGRIPGQTTPGDFEAWSNSLYVDRQLTASSQRRYQCSVRCFYDYLVGEPRYRILVRDALNSDLVQVSTLENSVVHRRERESVRNRRALHSDEIEKFFHVLDQKIIFAHQSGSKSIHALQRDKIMFGAMIELGLRASEALHLDLNSFEPNHSYPELGRFGHVRVFGKGSKWRVVSVLSPVVAEALTWYVDRIRPKFLANSKKDCAALFLSEQGNRLCYSGMNKAFHKHRISAGLPENLVPHSLRHTSVSQADLGGLSLNANRERHGHTYAATTQGYMHHPDAFTKNQLNDIIARRLQ
jgi:site-specific recombinase XerD